ncbi:hypothetical protein KUTeg_006103 [Tegillarca granosa]|uniref:Uncharacterized protein n=1 Tax=Tegillarca granosa TaxID=220873 RepID=A0ABQ9FFI6_TEGGR|nr:hypothetical protein KUTeg_006103 [Tegillarca granosa]
MRDIQKDDIIHEDKPCIKENGENSVKNGFSSLNSHKSTNDLDRETNNLSKMVTAKMREPAEGSDEVEYTKAKQTNVDDSLTEQLEKLSLTKGNNDLSQQFENLSLSKEEDKLESCVDEEEKNELDKSEFENHDGAKKKLHPRGPNGGVGRPMISQKGYEMNMGSYYNQPMQGGKRRMDEGDDPYFKYTRPGHDMNFPQTCADMPSQYMNGYQDMGNGYTPWGGNLPSQYCNEPHIVINSQATHDFSGGTVTIKSPTTEMTQSDFVEELLNMANGDEVKNNNFDDQRKKFQLPYQQQINGCMDNQLGSNMVGSNMCNDFQLPINGYSVLADNRNEMSVGIPNVNQNVANFAPKKPEKRESYLSESDSDLERSPYSYHSHSPGSISMNSPPPSNLSGDSGIDSPLQQDMYQSASPGKPMSVGGTSPPRDMFTPPTPEAPGLSAIKNNLLDTSPCPSVDMTGIDSSYVDSHLPELKDVLDVIGEDMIRDTKKKQTQDADDSDINLKSPVTKPPQPLSPQSNVASPPMAVPVSTPSPIVITTSKPVVTTGNHMAPKIVPQPAIPAQLPPTSVSTNGIPVSGGSMVILPPPVSTTGVSNTQQVPTTSTFVVLPPNTVPASVPLAGGQQPSTIIIVPVNTPPVAQKPKPKGLRQIAPKILSSSSPNEKTSANVITNTGTKPSPATQQPKARPMAPQGNGPKQPPVNAQPRVNNLLNVARRMVAEISRQNLPFKDDEGDTYLHVAVCRTDPNMVQALLERLMREKLQGMVDVQNNKRQTPLYLATVANQAQMVAMFVKCNANPNTMAQAMSTDCRNVEVKAPIHSRSIKRPPIFENPSGITQGTRY